MGFFRLLPAPKDLHGVLQPPTVWEWDYFWDVIFPKTGCRKKARKSKKKGC